ncbi:hypothetical protein H5410_035143 [Solanum commersonii]|uniref:Uncharacterized protein n=1 Tax=Solanum commersonii TaxID=4109 RepID=A0A9J5Y221_SOLCO|nr:hypothetical protein H5410_035143 [Solanum commersonii]
MFKRSPKQIKPDFADFHLSNGASWSRRANGPIFKFKRYPNQILSIFMCYNPWIFCDSRFQFIFGQNFSLMFIKTLVLEPVDPEGKTGPFLIHAFSVIQDSSLFFAKHFHGRPLRP